MRVKHAFGILTMLSVTLLTVASCTKEPRLTPTGSRHIRCIVGLTETKASSISGDAPGTFISQRTIKGDSGFDLIETVYENELPISYAPTKGKQITDDGSGINIATSGFYMTAYAEDKWHYNNFKDKGIASGDPGSPTNPYNASIYFGPSLVTNSSGSWGIAGEPTWLNDVPMTFWCWDYGTENNANFTSASYTPGSSPKALTFSYSLPTANGSSDAVNQKDMIFSFNSEKRGYKDTGERDDSKTEGSGTDESINIVFHHALSTVQFFTGDLPSGYRIAGISLENVASSADFSVTPGTYSTTEGWPLSFACSNYGSLETYAQVYTSGDAAIADRSSESERNHPGDEKSFFMIPQTLGSTAKLKITLSTGTGVNEVTNVISFSLNDTQWDADKYYVYQISVEGAVGVTIDESCNDSVKADVNFTNTKNVPEYFRAMIVANWYDDSGNIVAPWDSTQGSFSGLPGTGWTQGTDGFYYYTSPVATGASSEKLFTSYTKPTSLPSGVPSGAHLEMTILVQAVAYEDGVACTAAFD